MTTKRAATHDGHCKCAAHVSACRRASSRSTATPRRWGFFSGTCYGSEALPSSRQVARGRSHQARQGPAERLKAQAATLRDLTNEINTGTKAWVSEYRPGDERPPERLRLAARRDHRDFRPGEFMSFSYIGRDEKSNRIEGYSIGYPKTVAAVVVKLNEQRAVAYDRTVKEIATYIKWQQDRIANWTVQPLELRNEGTKPLAKR